ncbi:hypothetical protein HDU67_010224 [Dinochytrium kinnereticum]|nr:hypothetical protein HDU67_010224 [Dinochytrium kinnereticum]
MEQVHVYKRPSDYLKERSLTTEERLLQYSSSADSTKIVELIPNNDFSSRVSDVPIGRPLFEPQPSEVVLQSYKPFETYEMIVSFRNNDKFARRLKLEPISHPHFSICGTKNKSLTSSKIAPGMEVQFLLIFTPEEDTDYFCNLVCITDRERFLVPIRGYGARGLLDFPDSIVFSQCPVRFESSRTIFVRNIGNRPAKFILDAPPPFYASPSSGFLEAKGSMQIDICFNPECGGSFERQMMLKYDTGEVTAVSLNGTAEDANIRLEKGSLRLDNTYITLSSAKTIKIFNRSEVMAKFSWKQFTTSQEERQHRLRRILELDRKEEAECAAFYKQLATNNTLDLCDLAPISQRYKNARRDIEHDTLLFNNLVFSIQPCEGLIWPNSHVEVNVIFNPQDAGANSATAFCEVSGRECRLPLALKGDGIGPKARFSYDVLDIDEVFINTLHQYEVFLENRGDIDFKYSVQKPTSMFGPKFKFFPESGSLAVGEQQLIRINFDSDILGAFTEEFCWQLEGSPSPLVLTFRGHVVGPVFYFEVPELEFGRLSYGFQSSRTLNLINTSHIPMKFNLRMTSQDSEVQTEFEIEPSSGSIDPVGYAEVRVSFTPGEIKKYEEALAVDVIGVGEELLVLPIRAESIVPEISLRTPLLDYKDCFLAFNYQKNIELVNETSFPAHYELLSQEETAKNVYAYASRNGTGVIQPFSTQIIQVDIQIKRLGQINFPVFVRIKGNENIPLGVDISANGIGPNVVISSSELNWGKIPVLKDVPLCLTLTNDSPIPANFTCGTVSESSVFRVVPNIAVIAPGGVSIIEVTAYLDDCLKFTDILKIGIQSDGIHEIQLVARGQGSTITFDETLKCVDFLDVFSNRECSREFILVNKGRRAQTLHWSTEEERFARKDLNANASQVFEVFPSRFSMKPNQQQIIVIKGYSNKAIKCKETLVCQGTIDKDPARRVVIETTVTANFINPLIEVQPPLLRFISAHTRDEDFELLSQDLTLTNTSSLPLHLSFRCPVPYSVEPNEVDHRLNQGESIKVAVRYDPKYNTNRISCKDHAKLVITYSEHPQRDFVELFSEVTFPNLTFNSNTINFGCIPNDTEQKKTFAISNCSTLPVEYTWGFLESSVDIVLPSGSNQTVPISQVFDVMPTRGTLQPGESEVVEVTFYGHSGGLYNVTALCDVVGGPKYEVAIRGEASVIEYFIDKQTLDFGTQLYQEILEQDIFLSNTGKVNFEFNTVIFSNSSIAQKIMISPSSGIIAPHGRQRITVRFCPSVPEPIDDFFFIQLAFYEPFKIRVMGTGVFPHIQMNIPRVQDSAFDTALADAKLIFTKTRKKLTDPQAEADLEAEAERILLRTKTLEFLYTLTEDVKIKTLSPMKAKVIGSPILIHKFSQMQKAAKEKKSINSISESSHVKLSTYICNFGNVIRNTSRKKSFKLTNKSHYPISFTMDKSVLVGTGFSIEPDRVKLLPGYPHYESVEFQVTFQARSQSIGAVQMDIPINIVGGPTTVLTLRADVTLPDLHISSNEVDFGEVLCGQRKTVTIQLHNKNSVPCEWTTIAQEPKDASSASKQNRQPKRKFTSILKEFDINPPSGLLQPGEKSFVLIQFSPTDEKEYDAVVPFKVNMNGQPIPVHIYGRGFRTTIQFEPETIVMGPILPCSEGIDSKFFLYNPTNYPVEVYSLEFDQIYLEEEEILRHVEGYDGNALFLPPREPGQGLPEHIVENAQQKIKQKASGVHTPPETGVLAKVTNDSNTVGELETVSGRSPRNGGSDAANDSAVNIILHGPPLSGRTTQARKMQKTFGLLYLRIDEVIETSSHIDISIYLDSVKSKEPMKISAEQNDTHSPGKSHAFGSEDFTKNQSEFYDQFEQRTTLPDDWITEIIKNRLSKDDCSRGIVIDGLESKYSLSPLSLLKSILRALGDKKKIFFFSFSIDAAHIKDREATIARQVRDKDLDPMQVKDVTEEEYDNMTEAERENYDIALIKYKKKMKELQDRKKLERKHWEEEMALRMGERKAEEENSKNKKKSSRRMTRQQSFMPEKDKSGAASLPKGEGKLLKGDKGSMSPKLGRKNPSDKNGDRYDGKSDKADRLGPDADEYSSRYTLTDFTESFLNDSTFKRFESYTATLDPILLYVRDGERHSSNRQISASTTTEKKVLKNQKMSYVPVGALPASSDMASNMSMSTDDTHLGEDLPSVAFYEVNGSMDEESVFRVLNEYLPATPKADEGSNENNYIPPPFIEQIIYYPPEREIPAQGRYFQLQPPPLSSEFEEEGNANFEGTQIGFPTTSVKADSSGSTQSGNQSGTGGGSLGQSQQSGGNASSGQGNSAGGSSINVSGSNSKKVRPSFKVTEDTKIAEVEEDAEKEAPARFRWMLLPKERKELTVKFASNDIGKFEQILQFEVVGVRSKFSLACVGHCRYSQIIGDYKKIFPKWRKSKEEKTITHGEYVASSSTFEFGPLLYSKPREKYLEKFPENRAILNISNPSLQEIKVAFSLKNDVKSEVFFFDPPTMDLAPGQMQNFHLWAYPRSANYFEDVLIICVKDNPEPYSFKVSCIGVKPELEIDKRQLSFDKMLLGRSERREIRLKNNTLMPVAWKLVQVELLGDEFNISPLEGVIDSYLEQVITAEFRGTKPVVISRRSIRLEVSDTDKIGGVVQEVPILVTAEAYDIAMDLHFPKGYEGGLDFGVLKVLEEGKQQCTLKNKGKYEVGYRFIFDNKELSELFTITPQQGIMQPSDKPFPVQVLFKGNREMIIKDNSSLKCQFFEPITLEVTATISVKLCARAVFSRFSILPIREVNFGALVFGTKMTRQFTVENQGEFDFRFSIYKIIHGTNDSRPGGKLRTNSRPSKNGRATSPPTQKVMNRKELVKQADAANFGAFTVFPTNGIVAAGTKMQITVEFHSDTPGSFEEIVAIDISDRSPNDYLDVIEYRLIGESCVPGINTMDFASIFEEQTVCKRLELFNTQSNVYAEEDRVFYFGAYLAGQQAQVRFKISNPYKVPCDVAIATKPRSRTKSDAADFAFDVEPKKLVIPSHEHRYINITFHPTSIQSYAGILEAVVENVDQSKTRTLSFELRGEGTLPRVTIEKPSLRNKNGLPFLKFKRLLVGSSQVSPIVLKNEGIIPAKVKLEWSFNESETFECSNATGYHILKPQETRSIEVKCRPLSIQKFEGELRVRVIDNSFEDSAIQISGEGYVDDVTFDDLPNEADNELLLGDCFIGETKQVIFTATNHSTDIIRLNWVTDVADFVFSPTVAHIRPKSQKEISVMFCPKQPMEVHNSKAVCKLAKIRYLSQTVETEWDDRIKSVRWQMGDNKAAAPRKVVEHYPEPIHDVINSAISEHSLLLSALADYCSYECDVSAIRFKSTFMYQTRVYRFSMKNTGKVQLRYSFHFFADEEGQVEATADECPFAVTPSTGAIDPNDSIMLTVRFSPLDDGEYTYNMLCNIQNLVKDAKKLAIPISGTSMRPFCHFELEESDYLTSERRNPDSGTANGVPQVLPQNTRVIEFGSCGVKVRNSKRFYIVNPTNVPYEFEWICELPADQRVFRCLTQRGVVLSSKKFEMIFDFFPETVDLKESLWKFSILGHNISIPFLLVGQALEPNIYMDRVSVNFKSLLVGRQVKEVVKLINSEEMPFAFSFNETSSELGINGVPVLRFSPSSGTIGSHSEIPIEIIFCPSAEKVFNFNLVCNVKKKPTPVTMNVKGEGYEIHESIQGEMADGTVFELVSSAQNGENTVDFGQVQINEKRLKRVTIVNSGKFNFDFSWKLFSKVGSALAISPEIGSVGKGERVVCEVSFHPTSNITLKNAKAVCQIVNGRSYPISILGSGCKPLVKFSTNNYDFGTHFIYKPGMTPVSTKIKMTNDDVSEITFDIISPESNIFEIQKTAANLSPGESTDIEVTFYPREARAFRETVKVEINGLSTVDLVFTGIGAEFKVEVSQADSRNVNFGALRIGHVVTRSIKIINKSVMPATFSLGTPASIENLAGHFVTLSNAGECTLRPKGVLNVELKFQPQHRIPAFTEEIIMEAPGILKPLFMVTGACQGIEVKLENDTLPFGAVVQRSCTTRRIQLQNIGDIGAKFHWDITKFQPDFSISPTEGYISPGMDISLEITFHPVEINQDIRYENLIGTIEGTSPLYLTLTGMCIPQPIQNDILKFSTPVRQAEVKSVKLENKTSIPWHIRPIIENEHWSGPETVDIEPGQSKAYDITFLPLEMIGTGDAGRHEGSIFFPLPDGSGILYKLYGTSDKPLSAGTNSREIPCKTSYTEVLAVSNWLKRPQRFKVIIEVAKPDSSVILKGHDFIDVPALVSRDYKLNFYAYKEGLTNAKVVFKNEQTQEFMFYNLTFKSTPPGIISTLEMTTPVRQMTTKEVVITNPLPTAVAFSATCNHADLSITHCFIIQPRSDGVCLIEFLPLQAKESSARLTITSTELGVYQYDLRLISTPAGIERSLHFKVGLGGSQTQTFRFLSYAKSKTEYTCKIDSPDFSVEKSVMAPSAVNGGVEVCIDVTYEPSKLGDVRTQLLVSSTSGGDYICPLYGHCIPPRPQGPITIKQGSTASVPFKNVFSTSATFNFVVDNPAFSVKATETIGAKKVITMVIQAHAPTPSAQNEPRSAKVGKLTVTHKGGSNVSWIYYLRTQSSS